MKWFHHECSAKHDPRLQVLGSLHGAEGLGIYWGLLEEIGGHSETFHMKVCGISEESDQKFLELVQNRSELPQDPPERFKHLSRVPKIPLPILARILFTSKKKLIAVIETAVREGLFDEVKWRKYNVLYSPAFEHRADDYTRRVRRCSESVRTRSEECSESVRTVSEQTSESLRTISANVLPEQNRIEQKQNRIRTQQTREDVNLPTGCPHEPVENLAKSVITSLRTEIGSTLKGWNEQGNRFTWLPSESELAQILSHDDKARSSLCDRASDLVGHTITFPALVAHAYRLMLQASQSARITYPESWLRACLFGKRNGDLPWILSEGSFPPRSPP